MGTKNDPGEFDCYANAEPAEPMFVLLARDPLAPELVRQWAREYEDRKAETVQRLSDDWKPVARKAAEARKCADAMDEWREKRNTSKPSADTKRPEAAPVQQGFHAALHESCFGELPPMTDEEIDVGLSHARLLRWYATSLDEALARITVLEKRLGIDPLGAGKADG